MHCFERSNEWCTHTYDNHDCIPNKVCWIWILESSSTSSPTQKAKMCYAPCHAIYSWIFTPFCIMPYRRVQRMSQTIREHQDNGGAIDHFNCCETQSQLMIMNGYRKRSWVSLALSLSYSLHSWYLCAVAHDNKVPPIYQSASCTLRIQFP